MVLVIKRLDVSTTEDLEAAVMKLHSNVASGACWLVVPVHQHEHSALKRIRGCMRICILSQIRVIPSTKFVTTAMYPIK